MHRPTPSPPCAARAACAHRPPRSSPHDPAPAVSKRAAHESALAASDPFALPVDVVVLILAHVAAMAPVRLVSRAAAQGVRALDALRTGRRCDAPYEECGATLAALQLLCAHGLLCWTSETARRAIARAASAAEARRMFAWLRDGAAHGERGPCPAPAPARTSFLNAAIRRTQDATDDTIALLDQIVAATPSGDRGDLSSLIVSTCAAPAVPASSERACRLLAWIMRAAAFAPGELPPAVLARAARRRDGGELLRLLVGGASPPLPHSTMNAIIAHQPFDTCAWARARSAALPPRVPDEWILAALENESLTDSQLRVVLAWTPSWPHALATNAELLQCAFDCARRALLRELPDAFVDASFDCLVTMQAIAAIVRDDAWFVALRGLPPLAAAPAEQLRRVGAAAALHLAAAEHDRAWAYDALSRMEIRCPARHVNIVLLEYARRGNAAIVRRVLAEQPAGERAPLASSTLARLADLPEARALMRLAVDWHVGLQSAELTAVVTAAYVLDDEDLCAYLYAALPGTPAAGRRELEHAIRSDRAWTPLMERALRALLAPPCDAADVAALTARCARTRHKRAVRRILSLSPTPVAWMAALECVCAACDHAWWDALMLPAMRKVLPPKYVARLRETAKRASNAYVLAQLGVM